MPDPYRARRWREQGTGDQYVPDVALDLEDPVVAGRPSPPLEAVPDLDDDDE